jgi:hypothetical protein
MTTKLNTLDESLIDDFKKNISDNASSVDPEDQRDWFDLSYGYFLGREKSPEDAMILSLTLVNRNVL